MKKILLLFALPVMVMCAISCEKENDDSPIIWFDDPAFLQALLLNRGVDKNNDGQISEKEASAVTSLIIAGKQIVDMEEIKYFPALTSLDCSSNQLTSLDVSSCTALTRLDCSSNQLTSLDVSSCTALTRLDCSSNQLTNLNLFHNADLIGLSCDVNQLTTLDLRYNNALASLSCIENPLTKIILSRRHILSEVDIQSIISQYGDIIEYVE